MIGVQAIRQAHQRRTLPRYYFRAIAGLFLAVPELTSLRVLGELDTLKSLTRTALDLDRNQMDVTRMITLDTATVVAAKGNRYLAVAALLTLGQDKEITAAVRALTSKVTGLMEGIGARKREFERLRNELQEAMEDFRDLADKRLGNVRKA